MSAVRHFPIRSNRDPTKTLRSAAAATSTHAPMPQAGPFGSDARQQRPSRSSCVFQDLTSTRMPRIDVSPGSRASVGNGHSFNGHNSNGSNGHHWKQFGDGSLNTSNASDRSPSRVGVCISLERDPSSSVHIRHASGSARELVSPVTSPAV